MIDYDGTSSRSKDDPSSKESGDTTSLDYASKSGGGVMGNSNQRQVSDNEDDIFSDSDGEENNAPKSGQAAAPGVGSNITGGQMRSLTHGTEQITLGGREYSHMNYSKGSTTNGIQKPPSGLEIRNLDSVGASDIKAIAADASVFSFGDEDSESG